MTRIEWDRIPVVISFAEAKQMVETYGFAGSQGQTVLEGQRLVPREPSDTVLFRYRRNRFSATLAGNSGYAGFSPRIRRSESTRLCDHALERGAGGRGIRLGAVAACA